MKNLTDLFTLLETSRNMPQSGYALAGIPKTELSDLAQHQYLTTVIAWQLARYVNRKGGNINVQRVTEYALVHDLSELLGGDINFHYGRTHAIARTTAKKFEHTNAEFISNYFGPDKNHYLTLFKEFESCATDESAVSKIADLIECLHYKQLLNKVTTEDLAATEKTILEYADKCQNKQNTLLLNSFITTWTSQFGAKTPIEIITNN